MCSSKNTITNTANFFSGYVRANSKWRSTRMKTEVKISISIDWSIIVLLWIFTMKHHSGLASPFLCILSKKIWLLKSFIFLITRCVCCLSILTFFKFQIEWPTANSRCLTIINEFVKLLNQKYRWYLFMRVGNIKKYIVILVCVCAYSLIINRIRCT